MANLASFLSDPVQFMRSNHVAFVGVSPAQQDGGVYEFILRDLGKAARARAGVFLGVVLRKVDAGVFEIRYKGALDRGDPRLAEGETFRAIWSGYVPGGKAECVLDSAGDDRQFDPRLGHVWEQYRSRPAASVIGRRVGGRWGFWIQYTCCKGSVQQILAVKQLTPGIKNG